MSSSSQLAPPAPLTADCAVCRLSTNQPALLIKTVRSFPPGLGTQILMCPRCAARKRDQSSFFTIGALLFGSAIIAAGWIADRYQHAARSVSNLDVAFLPAMILFTPLMILLHELGHAIVGYLCGLKVFGICIGRGKRLLRLRVGSRFVDVGAIPLGGLCFCGAQPGKQERWRFASMLAAGPATHLLFICLLLAFAPRGSFINPVTNEIRLTPLVALLAINLEMLVSNLYPRQIHRYGAKIWNDGKRLINILSRNFNPGRWILTSYVMEFQIHLERHDPAQARRTLEEACPFAEKTLNFRAMELPLLAAEGNWPLIAQKSATELAAHADFPGRFPFLDWSAVAAVYTRGDLDEAQRHCDEVMAALPWDATSQVVCATVALALGDNATAEKFLRKAAADAPGWSARSATARAWQELSRQKGNPQEEQKWRRRANTLDPNAFFKIPEPAPIY